MKSRITSNVDTAGKLTPAQRKQAEADAKNDGLIQDAVDRAERDGPKVELLTGDQQVTTTYKRLAEQAAPVSSRRSIIPLAVKVGPEFPGGFHWILSDADMGAIEAGYACFYCLSYYPEMWAPACTVCGADRELLSKGM